MSGYVYMITNDINGKYYIGSHKGHRKSYMGSGVALNRAYNKYGKDNFTKHILHYCDDFQEAEERLLLALDAANDPEMYNMKNAGIGGMVGYTYTDEQRKARSVLSSGSNNGMYGRTHTAETRELLSKSASGPNHANYGKLRPKHSELMSGTSNPNYGKKGEHSPNHGKKRVKKLCPHCGQMVAINLFNRWHNENCKHK